MTSEACKFTLVDPVWPKLMAFEVRDTLDCGAFAGVADVVCAAITMLEIRNSVNHRVLFMTFIRLY